MVRAADRPAAGARPPEGLEVIGGIDQEPRRAVAEDAAAPSLIPDALPAVTVPSLTNAGRSAASFSTVVPARGYSSREILSGAPFFCGTSTATISFSNT